MPRVRETSLPVILGENEDDCMIRGWGQTCAEDGKQLDLSLWRMAEARTAMISAGHLFSWDNSRVFRWMAISTLKKGRGSHGFMMP